ncbi:MAG: hypothetical protein Q9168_000857 [Polycauliona sp. 1 TL-2023]
MLHRFHLCNLQDPRGQQPTTSVGWAGNATKSVLVSFDTSEYDELIAKCPSAALKYVDNDDGELIRLGSSLELAQRLQDPAPPRKCANWAATAHDSPLLSQYHTFDIDYHPDVIVLWISYVEKESHPSADQRNHFFRATNPPSMRASSQRLPLPNSWSTQEARNTGMPALSPHSTLTGEGKRQAQAAGDILRARYLHHHQPHASSFEASPATYQNRWASYNSNPSPFVPSTPGQGTVAPNGPSIDRLRIDPSAPIDAQVSRPLKLRNLLAMCDKTGDGASSTTQKGTREHCNKPELASSTKHLDKYDKQFFDSKSFDAPIIDSVNDAGNGASPSLIKVFDDELNRLAMKDCHNMNHQQEEENTIPTVINRVQDSYSDIPTLGQRSDGGISHAQTIQHGILDALQNFCTAIQDVADSVQDTSSAEPLQALENDKADETLLDSAAAGLDDLASATTLLQTQILPLLRSLVDKATRPESQKPVTSMLSGERNDDSPLEQPHSNQDVSGRYMNRHQSSTPPLMVRADLMDITTHSPTRDQNSGLLDPSPESTPSTSNFHNAVSSVVASQSTLPQKSRADDVSSSTMSQNVKWVRADDRVFAVAERSVLTSKVLEQESSTRCPAFRRKPNELPQMSETSCEESLGNNARVEKEVSSLPNREPRSRLQTLPSHGIPIAHHADDAPMHHLIGTRWSHPTGTAAEVQGLHGASQSDNIAANVTDHGDPATVARTQACVEKLEALGFGSTVEGGLNRLVVYAQASGGDLVEAIDLIADEKQAYEDVAQRGDTWQAQRFLI